MEDKFIYNLNHDKQKYNFYTIKFLLVGKFGHSLFEPTDKDLI